MTQPDRLVCPRDLGELDDVDGQFRCGEGHVYPTLAGMPVMLVEEDDPTGFAMDSLSRLRAGVFEADASALPGDVVDPVVSRAIVNTNGNLYRHLVQGLPRYPIPELRLPRAAGHRLLDVGAGWGRWSVAAARLGYRPTAVEPQIDLCLAARRVGASLDADLRVVAAGGTALPFADDAFDVAFSYSVLQHFDKRAARMTMAEMMRVTRPGGLVLIQLANRWGVRQLTNQAAIRAGIKQVGNFRIRYWRSAEIREAIRELTDVYRLEVDGFFSLNPQTTDLDMLPRRYRALVQASELLRRASTALPLLPMADSLYVRARVPA
jgi:SAM-dependent methyltransferase